MSSENITNEVKSADSLKDICIKYVRKHFMNFQNNLCSLPEELREGLDLKTFNNKELMDLAEKSSKTALEILKTPHLLDRLGRYNPTAKNSHINSAEMMGTGFINSMFLRQCDAEDLFTVCKAHPETRDYAIKNEDIKSRLSKEQLGQLRPQLQSNINYYGAVYSLNS